MHTRSNTCPPTHRARGTRVSGWLSNGPLLLVMAMAASGSARAQGTDGMQPKSAASGPVAGPATRAAIERARAMVEAGKGAASRTLLDSLVSASASESGDLADALYWRAVLSERAADAERDWKRLILDVPLSPRVPTALLRLGELEMVRGHPAGARSYLERLVRDHAGAIERPKASLWIVRSYFDERDVVHACSSLASIKRADVPEGELRLQAKELDTRCATESAAAKNAAAGRSKSEPKAGDKAAPTVTPPAVPPVARNTDENARAGKPVAKTTATTVKATTPAAKTGPTAQTGKTATVAASATPPAAGEPKRAVSATGGFSVQVAAFDTPEQADRMVLQLTASGLDARVDGDEKPFRVRIGHYETRAQVAKELARLKKKYPKAFVAVLTP